MNPTSLHRWYLGFVVGRWRHVFWLAPVVGVLIALGIHLAFFHRTEICAVIQVFVSDPAERDLILSDAVVVPVVLDLGLDKRWNLTPAEAAHRLRQTSRVSEAKGAPPYVAISYHDFNPELAVQIPEAIADRLAGELIRHRDSQESIEREAGQRIVDAQKAEVARRQAVVDFPQAHSSSTDSTLVTARAELDHAQRELETAQLHFTSKFWHCLRFTPRVTYEAPSLSQTYQPAGRRIALGLLIGLLATAPCAYLLEWLFPRRKSSLTDLTR